MGGRLLRELVARRPAVAVAGLLVLAALLRILDTFGLRSDERFGEQVVAKVAGSLLVLAYLGWAGVGLAGIGLHGRRWPQAVLGGAGAMLVGLAAGYVVEWLYLTASGARPSLVLSVRGFALAPAEPAGASAGLAPVVLLGNAVNAFLEEGLFRGIVLTHLGPIMGPPQANLLQAGLFGIWHWVWPVREVWDGSMSLAAGLAVGFGYTLLSFLMGLAFGWLYQGTDSLWAPWVAHTVNNSVYNVLHVVTAAGVPRTLGLRATVSALVMATASWVLASRR